MGRSEDIIAKYDKVATDYATHLESKAPEEELKTFFSYLRPKDKILDIGCAAGRDSAIFKDLGFEVTGVDLSTKLLEIARKARPDIPFILADMRKLPFEDSSFDAVWVNCSLHHLERIEMPEAVKEFGRVLKPNGILYIRTKMGEGTLKTQEAMVQGEEREFTLVTPEEFHLMLTIAGYARMSLYSSKSQSRHNVVWLNAFYRKTNA